MNKMQINAQMLIWGRKIKSIWRNSKRFSSVMTVLRSIPVRFFIYANLKQNSETGTLALAKDNPLFAQQQHYAICNWIPLYTFGYRNNSSPTPLKNLVCVFVINLSIAPSSPTRPVRTTHRLPDQDAGRQCQLRKPCSNTVHRRYHHRHYLLFWML